MKKHHKLTALVIAAVMSLSMIPGAAFADEIEETAVVTETFEELPESSETTVAEEADESVEESVDQSADLFATETEASEAPETDMPESDAQETEIIPETVETEAKTETEVETETETEEETETETEAVLLEAPSAAYSYKVTPLLPPFNEYFYVETTNPDPLSFRFADKSSIYSDEAAVVFDYDDWDSCPNLYADINYENTRTGRVKGGYIFKSFTTDGGELVVQEGNEDAWEDTSAKITLPALVDEVDYLINTYADKNSFFDNMDAVQSGFQSVCLYSGSYIRGRVIRPDAYWRLATAGHRDQSFYIYSPFEREDNEWLFASTVYPFRYDSLGFPSMMADVAERLDSASSYEWDPNYHSNIKVTYAGETRTYGGAGDGEGQGISKDKIDVHFDFSGGQLGLSFDGVRSLLEKYANIEMADDIPRDDELTWESICSQVGEAGAWARISNSHMKMDGVSDLSSSVFTFLYKKNDGQYFNDDEWGVGNRLYWSGDLGYARDSWVDGRYIDRYYIPGERFEDHPESDIILINVPIPQVSYEDHYEYNDSTSSYERQVTITGVDEVTKTARFTYETDSDEWIVDDESIGGGFADYEDLKTCVDSGQLDEKYLDMVTLTQDEVAELQVDKNTDIEPPKGYIYDGTVSPGTTFDFTGRKSISNVSISGLKNSYTYTGKAIRPSVTVKDGSKILTLGEDYEIDYQDNMSTGTASLTISGIGGYYNTVYEEYEILPADISKSVSFSATSNKWNGDDDLLDYVSNNLILKCNGVTLKLYSDYDAVGSASWSDLDGSVTLYIDGEGNYTGSIEKTVEVVSGRIILPNTLAKPVLVSATNVNGGVKFTWKKVAGAAMYRVFRRTYDMQIYLTTHNDNNTKKWTGWKKVGDTDSLYYTDKSVKSGMKYNYSVRCISASGLTYTSAYDTTGKTITYVAAPVISSITNVSGGVKIVWPKTAGAAKYRIFRKTGSGSWVKLIDTASATYTDKTAANGTTYSYTVRCLNSSGSYVSAYNTTGKKITYVLRPTISSLTSPKTKQLLVKWNKNAKATGYVIQYSTSSTFASGNKTLTIKGAATVSKTITSLTAPKRYYVRVRTYKTVSGKNYYSAWSAAKNVVTK